MDASISPSKVGISRSTSRLLWFACPTALSIFLMLAPAAYKWGNKVFGLSLLAQAGLIPIAWVNGGKLAKRWEDRAENDRIRDEAIKLEKQHRLDVARALAAAELRQISGQKNMSEMMADMQGTMTGTMQGMQQMMMAQAQPVAGQLKSAVEFEELDLAVAAAESDKSFLLSAPSGVGKTNFIRHLLHAIHRTYEGLALMDVVDFKGITGHYCGLEKTQYYIKSGAAGSNFGEALLKVNGVVGMLDSRKAEIPYYFISDEINNGILQAKNYREYNEEGKPVKIDPPAQQQLKSGLSFIATQGRERLIRGILTAHGNLMEMLEIDGDTAQSIIFAVMGRQLPKGKGNGFALIDRMFDRTSAIFNSRERQRLEEQLPKIKRLATQDGRAIALTNIRGEWEFVFLPASYANDPGLIEWEAQNQDVDDIETSTAECDGQGDRTLSDLSLPNHVLMEECIKYIELKGIPKFSKDGRWLDVEILRGNWAKNKGVDAPQLQKLLMFLLQMELIEINPENNRQIGVLRGKSI